MRTILAFTFLAVLIALCWADDEESLLMVRTFHTKEICEDKKDQNDGYGLPLPMPEEPRITYFFEKVSDQCVSHGGFLYTKSECTTDGWKVFLCTDSDCNECTNKVFNRDVCVGGKSQIICTRKSKVSTWIDLNQATIRLSIHKLKSDSNEENVDCSDENLVSWGYFRPDACETFGGAFFKIHVTQSEENKNAELEFFNDDNCSTPFKGLGKIPIPTDKCFKSPFSDYNYGIKVTLDANQS